MKQKLILRSAGKNAVLGGQVSANLFIDCRGIWNPFRVFGGKTGDDPEVIEWCRKNNSTYIAAAEGMINTALKTLETRGGHKAGDPLVVCFFCLAGVHRSRSMKNVVGELYQTHYQDEVEVEVL